MQKLRQKQLQQLKDKQLKTKSEYKNILDTLLHQQPLKILIQYCKQQLKNIDVSKIQNINDFSPVSISRLIFLKQLKQIKNQFLKLPNHQCPLEHFLLLMLKIVKFPFEKTPLYILGLKEMFKQIKGNEKLQFITYEKLQNYVMGQVVNFSDQAQHDTEFEIQFSENKMQDFLMHDNGVKKIHFSNDLKKYIILDQGSSIIKIYDQRMKIVAKFQPNKQKHNKKHPQILTFDYNQLGSKLGISLSDNTFSIVNLANFLQASSQQNFRSVFLNQVCYKSSSPIIRIQFLSMMNKWLCIDQSNQIWIYDVQKYKQQNQNYCKKFKHPNDDYEIKQIVQIIGLAAICFVINNQVWFFNQTLTKKKFKKFSHCEEIVKFSYVEQKNTFYLVGKQQKYLTMFTLNKVSGDANKIMTYQTNQIIVDFAVFPYFNSILILDTQNNLKVYNQNESLVLQHQQNYQNIVKKKQLNIKLLKYSKNQFLIHATYILVMQLKKVAIERDMDYNFLDTFYYDNSRQEITFSVNGQILGLALMHGQVRKNVANQNSNLQKHKAFYLGKNTQLFAIDQKDSLHQIYSKNDQRYKQNKDHRKAVGIINSKKSFYDQQTKMIIMISEGSVYIVRNDGENNFTLKSCLLLENSPVFIKYKYYPNKKYIMFLDANNTIYLMNSLNYQIKKIIKIELFRQPSQAQKMIIDAEYQQNLQIVMVLTNNGQFGLINVNDQQKCAYLKMRDILPYKLQSLTFTSFEYQKRHKGKKETYSSRLYLYNQTGWMIELQLDNMLSRVINEEIILSKNEVSKYLKDTHQLDFTKLLTQKEINQIKLPKQNIYKPQIPKQGNFIKVHDKAIVYSRRIMLQGYYLLTIGQDGHIKLWGEKRKLYFDLKLPLILKIEWNMNQLHQKRNKRIVAETKEFLQTITSIIKQIQDKQILNINNHKKKLKNKSQKIKINLENPIQLQIQNKDIEEIVMNNKQIKLQNMTIDVVGRERNAFSLHQRKKMMSITQRIGEPWRKKKQFKDIFQKASPVDKYVHKYKEKMPFDLLIMRNDLHIGQSIPAHKNHSKQKQQKLIILPELRNYLKNYQLQKSMQLSIANPQEKRNQEDINIYKMEQQNKFESCLFVKTQRGPKKTNAFDEIDKYFNKKQQQLLNKKWIPNKRNLLKKNQLSDSNSQSFSLNQNFKSSEIGRVDPVKSVIKIFQQHNKQAINMKKGRIIKIPYMKKEVRNLQKKNL